MRPPVFTGGNPRGEAGASGPRGVASMRPPEFTGGNGTGVPDCHRRNRASMRPPEFTGGNPGRVQARAPEPDRASMRPPEFTGGNLRYPEL